MSTNVYYDYVLEFEKFKTNDGCVVIKYEPIENKIIENVVGQIFSESGDLISNFHLFPTRVVTVENFIFEPSPDSNAEEFYYPYPIFGKCFKSYQPQAKSCFEIKWPFDPKVHYLTVSYSFESQCFGADLSASWKKFGF